MGLNMGMNGFIKILLGHSDEQLQTYPFKSLSVHGNSAENQHKLSYSVYKGIRQILKFPSVQAAEESVQFIDEEHINVKSIPEKLPSTVYPVEVEEFIRNETGMDRLRRMYSRNDVTGISDEITMVASMATQIAITGACLAAIYRMQPAKQDFMQSSDRNVVLYNKNSRFGQHRTRNDQIALDMGKTGFRWGVRMYFLFLPVLLVGQTVATYRNRTTPFDYAPGGMVAGAMNKFFYGPKAMVTGAGVFGLLSFVFGTVNYALLKMTGNTEDEKHKRQVQQMLEDRIVVRVSGEFSS